MKKLVSLFAVLSVVFVFAACKKNTQPDPTVDEGLYAPTTVEVSVEETPVVVEVTETVAALSAIHFALDQYNLTAESRKVLEANAKLLKQRPAGFSVVVEGNCDERGTISYNIALGEKRANEVKKYYVSLGIPSSAITTVSYGKEKPVCYSATETCYAKNRRADTLVVAR